VLQLDVSHEPSFVVCFSSEVETDIDQLLAGFGLLTSGILRRRSLDRHRDEVSRAREELKASPSGPVIVELVPIPAGPNEVATGHHAPPIMIVVAALSIGLTRRLEAANVRVRCVRSWTFTATMIARKTDTTDL